MPAIACQQAGAVVPVGVGADFVREAQQASSE